jgi:hypothetical protein
MLVLLATAAMAGTAAAGTATAVAGTTAKAVAAVARSASSDATSGQLWFDPAAASRLGVVGSQFEDGYGREVVLRGFNVSGEAKLDENGGLPFASTADARTSAAAMRRLTGANTVRFLLSWAYAEPTPRHLDQGYLGRAAEQMRAFIDQGFTVLVDYHQDLYSRYLFNSDSWYSGDGAPKWVVSAGGYPKEFCGICLTWGQNLVQNAAVQDATYDFWHNRMLTTAAGQLRVQSEFLWQAQGSLSYLRTHLSSGEFARLVGVDPFNEPNDGKFDPGQNSQSWETNLLWPFFQRFRAAMDAAGWQAKPAFVEPNVLWNGNIDFLKQPGGLTGVGKLGARFVFNSHFYDQKALSGILMLGKAGDGQYLDDFNLVRQRGAALDTPTFTSEFGYPVTGYTAEKGPSVLKAEYQSLDSAIAGTGWWGNAAGSGPPLSGTQWHWDIYSGRHHELMNGNPQKVQVTGDGWNGEDFSVVQVDAAGAVQLRVDPRVVDRVYPTAVAGRTLAFSYEDRARDQGSAITWNRIPRRLASLRRLVGSGQYAVVAWRSAAIEAPTELHLPSTFSAAGTTVVSDLGVVSGLPTYAARRQLAVHPIAIAAEVGGDGAQRLLLTAPASSGRLHYALITNGSAAPSGLLLASAQRELAGWAANAAFPA